MNIDWKIILLFITAGLDFAMTFFLLIKNFKDRSHLTFGLLSLFAGLWSLGVGMFLLTSQTEVTTVWLKLYYIAAACLAPLFYYFAVSFCYPVRPFRQVGIWAHVVAMLAIVIMVTNDSFLLVRSSWELITLNPYLYLVYSVYFLLVLIWGFRALWLKYRESAGFAKKQIGIVMLAILVAACFGVFFDLLLPFVSYRYIYWGPYFTAVMCVIIYTFIFIRPIREQ